MVKIDFFYGLCNFLKIGARKSQMTIESINTASGIVLNSSCRRIRHIIKQLPRNSTLLRDIAYFAARTSRLDVLAYLHKKTQTRCGNCY